jgi:peptide/nickel transport system substrate-binding protein
MTRMDRRALFTSGAAAALLAASGLSAATPRAGGRLRLALARDTGSFDLVMNGSVFDTLTEVAPTGVLQGELATGWQSSSDARNWQFDLRKDVTFHDGTRFGAADVVATLAAHGPIGGSEIKRIEALSRSRIRLELGAANPDLPYLLADSSLAIRPAAAQAPDGARTGTGLYRVLRLQPGRRFLGRRAKTHYKDGQAGWIETLEITVIPDAAVRAEALRDGYVDVAELPLPRGLRGRGEFFYHPTADNMALAAGPGVGVPRVIGARGPLDDGRIAERWWIG